VNITERMQPLADWLVTAVCFIDEVFMRVSLLIGACALMMVGLTACHEEGPAERAGKNIDHAGQSVRDTLDPPKGPVESAGRKIDRAVGN
jgi:hypothetical protein